MATVDVPLDALFGRDDDLARLIGALESQRLVSLTGPGGSGKTRLALAALAERDGPARFVDASPLEETSLLAPTILAALAPDAPETTEPVAAIAGHVADVDYLLVIDNLEQLDGARGVIAEILAAAPNLTILATSRIPLGVTGEVEIAVPPLALPQGDHAAAVEASPAGALFLARARSVGRLQRLDERDGVAIGALCRRLDGLPLAIELAAARTRILSPGQLLARLDRVGIGAIEPAGDARRSMAAILDWTIELLDDGQRDALEAAATCEGFDLDLLEVVRAGTDSAGALEDLVALGLVVHVGVRYERTRFRLLELIRRRVRDGLDETRRGRLASAHALAVVDRIDATWTAADRGESGRVGEMELEIDNGRRALATLVDLDPDTGFRLWRRLYPIWANARQAEAIDWFDRLEQATPVPTIELARSLADLSRAVELVHGMAAAHVARENAVRVARDVGDPIARASALSALAQETLVTGDRAEAERVAGELRVLLDGDDLDARLHAGEALAIAYLTLDGPTGERAIRTFEELVAIAVAERRAQMASSWYGNLSFLYLCRGEYDASVRTGTLGADAAREIDPSNLLPQLCYLASGLAAVGRVDEAVAALLEALSTDLAKDSGAYAVDLLRAGAAVELARGRRLEAARLAGAADTQGQAEGIDEGDRLLLDRTIHEVRRGARQLDVELALRDGAATDVVELLQGLAAGLRSEAPDRAIRQQPLRVSTPVERGVALRHGDLTKREVEILALVGQGRSDPEIAEILVISPKTASVHVANIKGKLGVESRLEIALRARDLGLA